MGPHFQSPGIWLGWVLKCLAAHPYQNERKLPPAPEYLPTHCSSYVIAPGFYSAFITMPFNNNCIISSVKVILGERIVGLKDQMTKF